jgi:hypothetical protein
MADHNLIPSKCGDEADVNSTCPVTSLDNDRENIIHFGSGDSYFVKNFIPLEEQNEMFQRLTSGEIEFQQWYHMPEKKTSKKALAPLKRVKVAMATAAQEVCRSLHSKLNILLMLMSGWTCSSLPLPGEQSTPTWRHLSHDPHRRAAATTCLCTHWH